MKHLPSLLMLGVLALGFEAAPADTLYVAGGDGLFQFNTAIGPGSESANASASASGLHPKAVTVDSHGNVFLATDGDLVTDLGDIYEITTAGAVLTIATGLEFPNCLAVDSHGNLFEGDDVNLNEFINTAGTLSATPVTLAVNGAVNGETPQAMAFDSSGDLFVGYVSGIIEFTNDAGALSLNDDFSLPNGCICLALDSKGDLFADTGFNGNLNEFINIAGTLSTTPVVVANIGALCLAFDSHDNLFIEDFNESIDEFSNNAGVLPATPAFFAGPFPQSGDNGGTLAFAPPAPPLNLYVSDNMSNVICGFNTFLGAPTRSTVAGGFPIGDALAFDNNGNLFVSLPPGSAFVRELTNSGGILSSNPILWNLTGTLEFPGEAVDGGMAFDNAGNLYVAELQNSVIGRYTFSTALGGWSQGDQFPFVTGAQVAYGLAIDGRGNLFSANFGTPTLSNPGADGGSVTEFSNLNDPDPFSQTEFIFAASRDDAPTRGIAFDLQGNLFVGEFDPDSAAWEIDEFANSGTGVSTSGTQFAAGLSDLTSLVFDDAGDLFAADGSSGNVYEFTNTGGVLSSTPVLFAAGFGNATALAINIATVVPRMRFVATGPGGAQPGPLVISWPATASGFVLQTNSTLDLPGWINYTGPINSFQGTNSVSIIPPPTGNLFFRMTHH